MTKKLFLILLSLILVSTYSHASENPYKFLKKEILIGKAKSEMKNDTRSISKKKHYLFLKTQMEKQLKLRLILSLKGTKMTGKGQAKEIKDGKRQIRKNQGNLRNLYI